MDMSILKDQLEKLGHFSTDSHSPRHSTDSHSPRHDSSHRGQGNHRQRAGGNESYRASPQRRGSNSSSNRSTRPERNKSKEQIDKEIRLLFERARMSMPPSGPKRFYFELRSGEVDFLEVDHHSHQALISGQVAVVADPDGRVCVINHRALSELMFLDPNWVPQTF